jgi:hypothetical protein
MCDVVFLGCLIDGSCFPQGRVPGTCLMCDPSESIFDFVVDPECTSETDPPMQNPPTGNGGDGEFPGDGGNVGSDDDPNGGGGAADAGIEITGDVRTGLAGGSVCSVTQARKRAGEGWLLLMMAALFVERSRRRTTRTGSR